MIVRQKHAHSWVEAYTGRSKSPDTYPIWITLDPTPVAAQGNQSLRSAALRETFDPLPIRFAISGSFTSLATMEIGRIG